jgi:hypothetical protein
MSSSQEKALRKAGEEDFSTKHKKYLANTHSFRKYGGIPDSQGKVHDLKDKTFARKINAPNAKLKRSLRHDRYEGHENSWTERTLARLNRK